MGLQNIWPEAIVVYPQGLPTKTTVDPQGLKLGWQISPGQNGNRDLKLVDAVLTHLSQKFSIDDRRIYATGFSNGGRFSYILWAQRPNLFAAFGICAGLIREPVRLTEPKPLLHIAGEKDEVAPFQVQQQTIALARQ
jgi:polyhydroxybutyrate depolymerase